MKLHAVAVLISAALTFAAAPNLYPDSAVVIGWTRFWAATGEENGNRVSVRDSQGFIHAVYCYNIGGPYADSGEIFYVYSTDNGITWSSPENISRTDSMISVEPDLVIDAQDHLHCVWKQWYDDTSTGYPWDVDLFYSQNNGAVWSDTVNITRDSAFSYCPKLGNPVQGNKLDLIWVSQWTRKDVIYLGLNPVGIAEGSALSYMSNAPCLTVYPNPFSNKANIRYMIHDAGCTINDHQSSMQNGEYMKHDKRNAALKIFDASGRLVKSFDPGSWIVDRESAVSWSGTEDSGYKLPAGVYFISVQGGDCSIVKKIIKLE